MSALIGWSGKESFPIAHIATAFDRIRDISLRDWRSHNICDDNGVSIFAITLPLKEEPRLTQVLSRVDDPPYSIGVRCETQPYSLANWLTIKGMVSGGETVARWVRFLELDLLSTDNLLAEITAFEDNTPTWDAPAGTYRPFGAAIVGFISDFLQDKGIVSIEGVGDGERFIEYMGHQTSKIGSLERAALSLIEQPRYICSAFFNSESGRSVLINSATKPRDTPYFYSQELDRGGVIYVSRPEMMPTGIGDSPLEPLPTGSVMIYPDHNNLATITDHE